VKKSFETATRWQTPAPSERSGAAAGCNEWFVARATWSLPALSDAPVSLRVAADSKYDLYLNGRLLVREGGLKRGPVPDGTYLDEIIIPANAINSSNTLGVLLRYFGKNSFSHRDSGAPGLLVHPAQGTINGWRMRRHPAYFNAGDLRPAFRLSENSVGYSELLAIPEWASCGLDDSAWPGAVDGGPAGSGPWGELFDRPIPHWRWSEPREYSAIRKTVSEDGLHDLVFCRLPHNAQLVPVITADTIPGLCIEARPVHDTNCLGGLWITGRGEQTHEFSGWVNAEEIVYRLPRGGVKSPAFRYRETQYDCDFSGDFHSGDEVLDALWEKARRTLLVTMRDTFMDCPCRERAQWPGDFVIQLLQVPYCLDARARLLVRKAADEFLGWQQNDGSLYGPVPEGNWRVELPAQMLTLLSRFGVWSIHRHSDEPGLLEDFVPRALRYLELWEVEANGLIRHRPDVPGSIARECDHNFEGLWDWIDWGHGIDATPALNAWMALALEGVELAARTIGQSADADRLAERRHHLVHAMRKSFWDPDRQAFLSADRSEDPDDRVQALMVLAGVATPEHEAGVVAALGRIELASPYMEYFVIEALFDTGHATEALARLRRRFRSLALNASSTLWERWPEWSDHPGTINHSWSGGPLVLLSERVAGLRPALPNWAAARIAPQPGDLKHFTAAVGTPGGKLQVIANRLADGWKVEVTAPPGMPVECDFSALGHQSGVLTTVGTGRNITMITANGVFNGT